MNTVDVATPLAFVTAVLVVANVPLAPEPGGVKVTVMPETGLPPPSLTVATSGEPNAALMGADCPEPLVAVIVEGAPEELVSEKFAGVVTPETVAVTV